MARKQFSSAEVIDETYDLRGLNLTAPDQVMPKGESPYQRNNRMHARDDDEERVTARTRKGSSRYCTPNGETNYNSNSGLGEGELGFTTTTSVAVLIPLDTANITSQIKWSIRRGTGATGHVLVSFYRDAGAGAGPVTTEYTNSSILSSDITDTFAFCSSYLMDGIDPTVVTEGAIWAVFTIQDNGTGTYYLETTSGGAAAKTTSDGGQTWTTTTTGIRYHCYSAISGGVTGAHRRNPSNGEKRTLISQGAYLLSVDNAGTLTSLGMPFDASADKVRMDTVDDTTFMADGVSALKQWTGTGSITDTANAPAAASNVIVWQNRLFALLENNLVKFTGLYDFDDWPSTNFFYVPSPKSADHVAAWRVFQDNLLIWTHETKHIIFGSDISTFTRKEAVGTKGAVSQEATAVDRKHAYFMADDKQIYRFNGVNDDWISRKVEAELQSIPDATKVTMHIYRNQLRVYYTKNADGLNDRCLIFDIESEQWFMDTGRKVRGSLELTLDNNELIEYSSVYGGLFKGETGYSDAGKAIDWEYRTPYKIYGSGASKKRVRRFRPYVSPTDQKYTMQIGKDFDYRDEPDMRDYIVDAGGARWGEFNWGDGTVFGGGSRLIDNKTPMSGRGKHVQYRFKRKGVETPVELLGYWSKVKVGRAR